MERMCIFYHKTSLTSHKPNDQHYNSYTWFTFSQVQIFGKYVLESKRILRFSGYSLLITFFWQSEKKEVPFLVFGFFWFYDRCRLYTRKIEIKYFAEVFFIQGGPLKNLLKQQKKSFQLKQSYFLVNLGLLNSKTNVKTFYDYQFLRYN